MRNSQLFKECDRFMKRALKDKGCYTKGIVIGFLISGAIGSVAPLFVQADTGEYLAVNNGWTGSTSPVDTSGKGIYRDTADSSNAYIDDARSSNRQNTNAEGENSLALGAYARATGVGGNAIGFGSSAYRADSIAIGRYSWANGERSIALGMRSEMKSPGGVAIGANTGNLWENFLSTKDAANNWSPTRASTLIGASIQGDSNNNVGIGSDIWV